MELHNFGFNAVTIGFCGTIFFTLISVWGLYQQAKTIWLHQSGQSVSVFWFSYNIFLFNVGLVYGISLSSIALIFNGSLLGLMHLPILIGLGKYKGFTRLEKFSFLIYVILLALTIVLPYKGTLYLLFSFGNVFAQAMQPWEIVKQKNSGRVEVKLLIVYLTSTLFWVIYAFATRNLALEIICPIYLTILTATLVLWKKYKV
jgi:uncharacterized protein with PQ loop repeat